MDWIRALRFSIERPEPGSLSSELDPVGLAPGRVGDLELPAPGEEAEGPALLSLASYAGGAVLSGCARSSYERGLTKWSPQLDRNF